LKLLLTATSRDQHAKSLPLSSKNSASVLRKHSTSGQGTKHKLSGTPKE